MKPLSLGDLLCRGPGECIPPAFGATVASAHVFLPRDVSGALTPPFFCTTHMLHLNREMTKHLSKTRTHTQSF